MEHKGFTISFTQLREEKRTYIGLMARKQNVRIESPYSLRLNHKELRRTINEFINQK